MSNFADFNFITALRFISGLILLGIASFQDLKAREIEDYTWKLLLTFSLIFLFLDFLFYKKILAALKAPLLFISAYALVYLLERFGIFQSGDSKLILALSFIFPELPNENMIFPAFFMSVFSNAVLLSLLFPVSFLILNIYAILKGDFKFEGIESLIKIFSGYYKKGKEINKFEAVIPDSSLREFLIHANKAKFIEKKKIDSEKKFFVTPAIPFAFLIFYGFIVSFFFGDLVMFFI